MPALDSKANIIAELDAIDSRTYGGPFVGNEKVRSKGVIPFNTFKNLTLDFLEGILDTFVAAPGAEAAAKAALLSSIANLRDGKPPAGLIGGRAGNGPGPAHRTKNTLSGLTVVRGQIQSTPLSVDTHDTFLLSIAEGVLDLVAGDTTASDNAFSAIDNFDNVNTWDGDGAELKVPRSGNVVRRGETQKQFQEKTYDLLRTAAEALP